MDACKCFSFFFRGGMMSHSLSNITSVYVGARRSESSTEHFLYLDQRFDSFYVALYGCPSKELIGYAEYQFICHEEGKLTAPMLHALTRLLPADAQCPGPIIPLKAVLYRSREVLQSLQASSSSRPGVKRSTLPSGSEEANGGFPHEI